MTDPAQRRAAGSTRPPAAAQVGVKDVARRAGVSLGTVSNVLNRPDRVGAQTKAKVLAAIDELGFVRNEAARQLRAGRSRTIGLVVLDVANPFFTDVAAGVEAAATEANLTMVLCNSGDQADREAHHLQMLEEQRAFGILITPLDPRSTVIEAIRRRGTNVVNADGRSNRRSCSVGVNDVLGGELAAGHLLGLGHRRIAFVGGPATITQVSDRLAGAMTKVRSVKGATLANVPTIGLTFAAGRRAGGELLDQARSRRPTAVFCANDLLAVGLLQEAVRRGVAVPDQLAIIGYDDIDFAAASTVPLSSVRQPRFQLGRTAAELLIDEVDRPETHRHRHVVFEPELVVRESTAGHPAG